MKAELEMQTLIILILTILSFIIIAGVFYVMNMEVRHVTGDMMCAKQIENSVSGELDLSRCNLGPEDRHPIGADKYDEVKENVADDMVDCWNMVGMGEYNPYKPAEESPKELIDNKICLICSIISFEDIDPFNNMHPFLVDKSPSSTPGKKIEPTYANTLYGGPLDEDEKQFVLPDDDGYDTSKDYAVVWVVSYAIPEKCDKHYVGGCDYEDPVQRVILTKYSEVANYCSFVMN